jgi:hypothetical protein
MPPLEKIRTETVIPVPASRPVSHTGRPEKMPVAGPITNLNMLMRKTEPHLTRCAVTRLEFEVAKLEFLLQFTGL